MKKILPLFAVLCFSSAASAQLDIISLAPADLSVDGFVGLFESDPLGMGDAFTELQAMGAPYAGPLLIQAAPFLDAGPLLPVLAPLMQMAPAGLGLPGLDF